jgi:DNA-binding beta-propeller fold protein YncE
MSKKKSLFFVLFLLSGMLSINAQLVKLWETKEIFKAPESLVFDPQRGFLYVSNLIKDVHDGSFYGDGFISKTNMNGEIIKAEWITNLTAPTGVSIFNDMLYIVERFGVVIYDLKQDKISNRYLIQNTSFLNDITVDLDTNIYITDSGSKTIYKIKNGNVEKWLETEEISYLNGILYDDGKLIIGVNGDTSLKSVDIKTKEIQKIAMLGEGAIDGIKKCGDDYLVSHFQGNIYLVKKNGEVKELLNTREQKIDCADFEYIEDENMIIVPALWNNKLIGYQYKKQ